MRKLSLVLAGCALLAALPVPASAAGRERFSASFRGEARGRSSAGFGFSRFGVSAAHVAGVGFGRSGFAAGFGRSAYIPPAAFARAGRFGVGFGYVQPTAGLSFSTFRTGHGGHCPTPVPVPVPGPNPPPLALFRTFRAPSCGAETVSLAHYAGFAAGSCAAPAASLMFAAPSCAAGYSYSAPRTFMRQTVTTETTESAAAGYEESGGVLPAPPPLTYRRAAPAATEEETTTRTNPDGSTTTRTIRRAVPGGY